MKSKKLWIFALGIIFLLCIPLIIERINPKYISAGDAFSYWGTIIGSVIGAFVAIIGVHWTLKQSKEMFNEQLKKSEEINKELIKKNQEKFEEERRLSVLPIITISENMNVLLNTNPEVRSILTKKYNDDKKNINNELESILDEPQTIFIIENENCHIYYYFEAFDKEYIIFKCKESLESGEYPIYMYAPFIFRNSGLGTAVNFIIEVDLVTMYKDVKKVEPVCNSIFLSLKPNEEINITFYCSDFNYLENFNLNLRLQYNDIYEKGYYQEHVLTFKKSDKLNFSYLDTTIKQKQI